MVKRIFFLIGFFQVTYASLQSPELKDFDLYERKIQDRFAAMLNVTLSIHVSTADRNKYLNSIASRLRLLTDDQVKQSVHKLDVLKEIMSTIDYSFAAKQLSPQATSFLSQSNEEYLKKNDIPLCVSECTEYLIDYLKIMQKESCRVKNENSALRKNIDELQKKYNATFVKSFFDCVNDKRVMRLFCAVMGLIILMNAAASWNLDPLEHMILTFVGFSGFFALGVTPFI